MKTFIKIAIVLILVIVITVVALGYFVFSSIDKIAKSAVEYGGTYATQVDTTVETMDVAITKGTVEMSGLTLANPAGFTTDHFFTLATTNASFDLESLQAEKYIIPSVNLKGIDVILDKGKNPSNYNTILNSLKRFESGEAAPADNTKKGKDVIIKSLVIEDINIHLANMPGVSLLAGEVAINIPMIELQNIGEEESMNASDIFNLVIKTVLAAAVEAGGGIIPGDILGELGNGLAGLTSLSDMGINAISDLNLDEALGDVNAKVDEAIEDLSKEGEKVIEDAQESVDKAIDDASDKLKNMFGGKKEDDDG